MLKSCRKDLRWLCGSHIAAIGSKTAAAIEAIGLHVDFMPKQFSQEGMLADIPSRLLEGKRALILSAQESRDVLEQGLRQLGMNVTKLSIYRTVVPRALLGGLKRMCREPFDLVTVTSASCVEHLVQAMRKAGKGKLVTTLRFASIGPITSRAVLAYGAKVLVEAKVSTIEGLVDAIVKKLRHSHV
jgi:uroporphyrinogen III methyltransferase/synthase